MISEYTRMVWWDSETWPLNIHLGATKIYQDLKRMFWWPGMKKEVVEFAYTYLTCQKSKIEYQQSLGLIQLLSIPEWKWDNIPLDFVIIFLKLLFKIVVLIVAIVGAQDANVKGLPPCCPHPDVECQPVFCDNLPCCQPLISNTNNWNFAFLQSYYETNQFVFEKN